MKQSKKPVLLPIFLVVFFGYIGLALPYSIFSPMFLYPERSILPESFSIEMRTTLLGVALALYPLGQFFGFPLIGKLSDYFRRKRVLMISLIITGVGYCLMALAISHRNLPLLLICRFICGCSEGNVVIAQSAAADLTRGHQKVRIFSLITLGISLGFIIGPILGGMLSSSDIVSWFSYATPFWFSVLITAITFFTVVFFFPEKRADGIKHDGRRIFKGMFNIKKPLSVPKLPFLYLLSFLFYLGMLIFLIIVPVYQAQKFGSSSREIANTLVYTAVFVSAIQLILATGFSKKFHPYKWAAVASFLMVFFLIIFTIPSTLNSFYLTLPPVCICVGIIMTSINLLISNRADEKIQGAVMGFNGSVIVAAETISALLGGSVSGLYAPLPFLIAAGIMLLGSFLMFFARKSYTSV